MAQNPSTDPFSFIAPNPNTFLSQEDELLEGPLARQSQFQDSESESQWMSSSPPNQIIIESLPETNPNQDDDKFLTPPEHHFSTASDSDNLKSSQQFGQPELTDGLEAETTVDLGCDCVIMDHQMENGGLGGGIVSRGGVHCGKSSQETETVAGSDFGENVVLEEEIVSKGVGKEMGLGGGVDCAKSSQETENVETGWLDSEETVELCGNDEIMGVDDEKVKSRVELRRDEVFGTGGGLGFGMPGDIDEEQCDSIVRDIVTKVGCEFDKIGDLDRELVSEKVTDGEEGLKLGGLVVGNVEHIESIDTDTTLCPDDHAEEIKFRNENLVTHVDLAEKDTNEGDEVSKRKPLDENVGYDRGVNLLRSGGKELVYGEGDGHVRERVTLSGYCQDINAMDNGGHKEDVNLGRTGKRKRRAEKRKLRHSNKTNLGKSKEDIEKFKYVNPSDGVEDRGRDENRRAIDENVSGEASVPLTKRSECPLSEGGQGSVKIENIRFRNLINKAAELLKKEVDSDTQVDLIEILKKKGVKFPRPSWWPPEGFN